MLGPSLLPKGWVSACDRLSALLHQLDELSPEFLASPLSSLASSPPSDLPGNANHTINIDSGHAHHGEACARAQGLHNTASSQGRGDDCCSLLITIVSRRLSCPSSFTTTHETDGDDVGDFGITPPPPPPPPPPCSPLSPFEVLRSLRMLWLRAEAASRWARSVSFTWSTTEATSSRFVDEEEMEDDGVVGLVLWPTSCCLLCTALFSTKLSDAHHMLISVPHKTGQAGREARAAAVQVSLGHADDACMTLERLPRTLQVGEGGDARLELLPDLWHARNGSVSATNAPSLGINCFVPLDDQPARRGWIPRCHDLL